MTVAIGLLAGPAIALAQRGAEQLIDGTAYRNGSAEPDARRSDARAACVACVACTASRPRRVPPRRRIHPVTTFVWNLLLAVIWATVLDDLSPRGLFIGFVAGYLVLAAAWRLGLGGGNGEGEGRNGGTYFRKVFDAIAFVFWFARELTIANFRMMRFTVSPLRAMAPGIVAVPLDDDLSDLEITTLASLVSLTPGTLSLDVTHDRRTLYVHTMDASDPDAVRAEVKNGFEARVKGILR